MNSGGDNASAGGIYILLIEVAEEVDIRVGALGETTFDAGSYAYVGSAMNGIRQRLQRHMSEDKRLYWHVDYLLQHAKIADAVSVYSSDPDLECVVARNLSKRLGAVRGFGSSDCNCSSHLFYHPDFVQLREHVTEAVAAVTQ